MKPWAYLGGFLVGMVAFVLYLSGRPGVLAIIGASVPVAAYLWWQKRRDKKDWRELEFAAEHMGLADKATEYRRRANAASGSD